VRSTVRGDAPVGRELLAVEQGEGDVGVADVDRQEHWKLCHNGSRGRWALSQFLSAAACFTAIARWP